MMSCAGECGSCCSTMRSTFSGRSPNSASARTCSRTRVSYKPATHTEKKERDKMKRTSADSSTVMTL